MKSSSHAATTKNRRLAYGYINVDDRNEPVQPHPEKSQTLVRIFELYATGSYTFQSIADKLQREGHVFRKSQPYFSRGGNLARFKQPPPTRDPGFGLFEPYFDRRKPRRHKEKALRLFGRRARFEE